MKKAKARPIITPTTDFRHDLYVGQIKGVILSINERVRIVDVSPKSLVGKSGEWYSLK